MTADPWPEPEADEAEARRMIWQQMNPRWHFTPPWYSPDGLWHARCGNYTAESSTLGRLIDRLLENEQLEDLPEMLAAVRPRGNPVRAFQPGSQYSSSRDRVLHEHHDQHAQ